MAWPLPMRSVLGVFGKKPEAGRVKTRLSVAYGPAFAAEAYEAMLFDTLALWASDRVLAPGGRRVLVFDPPDVGPWFDDRAPDTFALQPQTEGDLGDRLRAFFEGEFADGAEKVVVIGSDSPTLDPNFVVSAFVLLDHKEVVLGPATDGGYYLLGCRASRLQSSTVSPGVAHSFSARPSTVSAMPAARSPCCLPGTTSIRPTTGERFAATSVPCGIPGLTRA